MIYYIKIWFDFIWNLFEAKPLHIRLDKIDVFIRIHDETRCLTLFGSEMYDAIYNKIRYFISPESSTIYIFSHYFMILYIYYDSSPLENDWLFIML